MCFQEVLCLRKEYSFIFCFSEQNASTQQYSVIISVIKEKLYQLLAKRQISLAVPPVSNPTKTNTGLHNQVAVCHIDRLMKFNILQKTLVAWLLITTSQSVCTSPNPHWNAAFTARSYILTHRLHGLITCSKAQPQHNLMSHADCTVARSVTEAGSWCV